MEGSCAIVSKETRIQSATKLRSSDVFVNCPFDSKQQYRYQKFISDIAGQDIHPHNGEPEEAIRQIRKWLAAASKRRLLPGGTDIIRRYRRFQSGLPTLCEEAKLEIAELTFNDLAGLIVNWLRTNR